MIAFWILVDPVTDVIIGFLLGGAFVFAKSYFSRDK